MGMGEPAHNLDNVLEAIDLLGTAGGIGHKNLVFSTVGDARVFERLPLGRVKPALALSLHSTRADAARAPAAARAAHVARRTGATQGERYARATGYPMQVQWTLLDGINDGDDEIDGLVRLLAGRYAVLNLIPYNTVDGLAFRRPARERSAAMARALHRRGVLTKLRHSAAPGRGRRLRPASRARPCRRPAHGRAASGAPWRRPAALQDSMSSTTPSSAALPP